MMQNQGRVVGATSAAIVWMLAAIGCAIGFKKYDIAIVISILSVLVLTTVERLEKMKVIKKAPRPNQPAE
jgi:putative Mg2+ transporter-C (MgtC) family protein